MKVKEIFHRKLLCRRQDAVRRNGRYCGIQESFRRWVPINSHLGAPRGPERSGTETRRLASSLHLLKLIWGSFLGVLPRVFVNVTWQACELQATSPEAHAGEPEAGRSVPAPPSMPTCSPPVLQTGGL